LWSHADSERVDHPDWAYSWLDLLSQKTCRDYVGPFMDSLIKRQKA
jgi:hypothetical protein